MPPARDPLSDLHRLLGQSVVLLQCAGKKPIGQWGRLTIKDMTPSHLARLKGGNIGVALGSISSDLCVIDFDDDSLIEPFLALNPALLNTFRTRGARGCALWIRLIGMCPRTFKLKMLSGKNVGEFRSNGSQSIVWGIHPDTKKAYQWLVKQPAVEVEFDLIQWPEGLRPPSSFLPEGELFEGDVPEGSHPEGSPPYNCLDDGCECPEVGAPGAMSPPVKLPTIGNLSRPATSTSVDEKTRTQITQAVEIGERSTKQNNEASFRACIALIQIRDGEDLSGMSRAEQIYFAETWHSHLTAKGRANKPKSHYLNDIFSSIKNAKRRDFMSQKNPVPFAWELAQKKPLPPEAASFEGDETMQRLIALCYQLHLLCDGGDWFIARNKVGELMGLDSTATRNLSENFNVLVSYGILEIVKAHDKATGQATTYRYIECCKSACATSQEEPA